MPRNPRPAVAPLIVAAVLAAVVLAPPACAGAASAPPKVVASINPLFALALAVTEGVETPDGAPMVELLMPPGQSPHSFQLRPSDARKLSRSTIVLWFGPELETALAGAIQELAVSAHVVTMLAQTTIQRRMLAPSAESNNGEPEAPPAADALGEDHGDDHEPEQHLHKGGFDPHVWLDTRNATAMVDIIARTLAEADPANAVRYNKNAKVAKNRIHLLTKKMDAYLAPVKTTPFLVQHDGYGYLVAEFGLNQAGFVSPFAGREPGARHVSEILGIIKNQGVRCLFTEPQFPVRLAQRLADQSATRLGQLDPLGVELEPGPTLYVRLMQQIARQMAECLGASAPPES